MPNGPRDVTQVTIYADILEATDLVRSVLVVLPRGHAHKLLYPEDLKLGGNATLVRSLESDDWLETAASWAFRINLDPWSPYISEGRLAISFPVQLPAAMPAENVWNLALCASRSCSNPKDASVLASFAVLGFQF